MLSRRRVERRMPTESLRPYLAAAFSVRASALGPLGESSANVGEYRGRGKVTGSAVAVHDHAHERPVLQPDQRPHVDRAEEGPRLGRRRHRGRPLGHDVP